MALQQVSRDCPAAATSEHAMDMQRWFVVRADRNIANEGSHFGLFISRDALVLLGLPVEISKDARPERSNGSQLRSFDFFLFDETFQARHCLVTAFKHDDKG